MGAYYIGSNDGVFGGNAGPCSTENAIAAGSALIYDPPTFTPPPIGPTYQYMCWKLAGLEVIIGPNMESIEQSCSKINFNYHVNGNQMALPTNFDLPKAGGSGGIV